MSDSLQAAFAASYLSGSNAGYLEALYEQFLQDPHTVEPQWRQYFASMVQSREVSHAQIRQQFLQWAQQPQKRAVVAGDVAHERKQTAVNRLIDAYRAHGHLAAKIDPLGESRPVPPQLSLAFYPDLEGSDLTQSFHTQGLMTTAQAPLQDIITTLEHIYCNTVGAEFEYIENLNEVQWIQQRLEHRRPNFSADEKRNILKQLIAADGLEKYLGSKYVGQKRFSLEGGDSFIPFVHALNEQAAQTGVQEVVVGMAHRGRLNILINVFGKPPEELFREFEGRKDYGLTSGDVKYHNGYASDIETKTGALHISLAFNPSHLEVISAVLMGSVRARQERRAPGNQQEVMGLLVHGDASVAGQGIVMETLNMSQTNAYQIGGSVHIVINNQVGFTTSNPQDARSSRYCTDIAKMIDAPVFHVNGDDPEAVVYVARLAVDYRRQFGKDVFVDLVCYRRLGHNEADEPAATQPTMYHVIRNHLTPREMYAQRLLQENMCTQADVDAWIEEYRDSLDAGLPVVKTLDNGLAKNYVSNWKPYLNHSWDTPADTAVAKAKLMELSKQLQQLPEGFEVQRQVSHVLEARAKMGAGELPLDWGYAETLAYATLLDEGYPVRMSGQDCRRGTFAHRHAVLHDQKTGELYTPLEHLSPNQASFAIYDSLLSEAGTMGFEYGYASTDPKTLTLWEAQYGDFANGAQIIADQFMSSAYQKWGTLCGLTLLLPHGYEGAGPEHTSARLERYLQLCAQDNMQVCVPTTPAQIFHLLRRQVIRPYRTPLIVMTPKSLLRNKLAVSSLDDLSKGNFQPIIPELDAIDPQKVERIILCSGKVYYELLTQRREQRINTTAILRIEQLYPFPKEEFHTKLQEFPHAKEIVWCQEEPQNQGAWYVICHHLCGCLTENQTLRYAGRKPSASPAAGYMKLHVQQQAELINQAFGN